MVAEGDDRPSRVPWPPLLYAATLGAAVLIGRLLPVALPVGAALRWAGGALFAAGVGVAVAGALRFRAVGTPIDPTSRARALATGGVYALTRNPMYLGAGIAFTGLALLIPLPWLLPLLPVMMAALYRLAIRREEAYLERRFGDAYRAYRARVRRWL